jgi:hypothetical protein
MKEEYLGELDPIVKEIPIFLSSQLQNHLNLFQFPIRSQSISKGASKVEARIKAKSRVVEIEVPLDVHGTTYDPIKGEEFADEPLRTIYDQGTPAGLGIGELRKEKKALDRLTLSSTSIPPMTNYFVAAMREGIYLSGYNHLGKESTYLSR